MSPSPAMEGASAAPVATPGPTIAATPSAEASAFVRPLPIALPDAEAEPALERLWSAAGPAMARAWTANPAVDTDGRVWAASSFDDAFWIVDRDGAFLESWGSTGSGEGQFRLAADGNGFGAIVFRPDGGFYVADTGNARVQQFDADRGFVREFGAFGTGAGEFILPLDIDLDAAGNVYVYDGERLDVQVFSPDGVVQRVAATHVGPYAAVDPDGNVYAIDNAPVVLYRYTHDGTVDLAVDLSGAVGFATSIAISPTGDLFIPTSDTGGAVPTYESLLQLDAAGKLQHRWPNGAEGIAFDPDGDRIYVTGSNVFTEIMAYQLPAD